MGMFGYIKIPDVILSLVSPEKLNWTHTFDTHCIFSQKHVLYVHKYCKNVLVLQKHLTEGLQSVKKSLVVSSCDPALVAPSSYLFSDQG